MTTMSIYLFPWLNCHHMNSLQYERTYSIHILYVYFHVKYQLLSIQMWQSQVEIKHDSIEHFHRVTAFEAL